MPENEAFLSENGLKLPVFSPLKFLCSTCAQPLKQTIKKFIRENENIFAPHQLSHLLKGKEPISAPCLKHGYSALFPVKYTIVLPFFFATILPWSTRTFRML